MSRRPTAVLLGVGLVLLVVAAVGVLRPWSGREPDSVGAERARALASASPPVGRAAPVAVRPGALPSDLPEVAPRRLTIDAIGVDATVVPVGLGPSGTEMDVPAAVDRVGWYRFGPALDAASGSIVIAGHVDNAEQGDGAFVRLVALKPGDTITLVGSDRRIRRYRVVAREVFGKDRVPLDRLFARDGAPRLTLITCGGAFDRDRRSYRDNIVITAVEEGAP